VHGGQYFRELVCFQLADEVHRGLVEIAATPSVARDSNIAEGLALTFGSAKMVRLKADTTEIKADTTGIKGLAKKKAVRRTA
jgi:hypothetical protein